MFGIDDAALATAGVGLLSYLSGQKTNEANQEIAASNNAWSAEQYAKRYQTQVKDIQAAGLNPMLAYSQSPGSAPSAQQVVFQNPMSAASEGMRAVSGAAQSLSSAKQADTQVKQIEATVDKIKEETKNIPIEGDRLKYAIQLLAEQAAKTAQEGQTQTVIRKQLEATILKLKSETTLLNLDVDAARLLDNLGRESKQLQPVVDVIRSLLRK
jgi:hypothetical protein